MRAVFFDVGETILDETRQWGSWADWLGVPRLTMFAAVGAVVARGEHHHAAFELVAPGIDLAAVFIRRGPWGILHARRIDVAQASLRIESLSELPAALRSLSSAPP